LFRHLCFPLDLTYGEVWADPVTYGTSRALSLSSSIRELRWVEASVIQFGGELEVALWANDDAELTGFAPLIQDLN